MTETADVDISTAPVWDNRDAFADELTKLAEADQRIVAVCNDSVGSSKLGGFQERFPERLINVGIAEQDMVGVAAGLASTGHIPFVCSAAPFVTGRSLEQVKADVAYSQHPVILCGMSPGVAYGELGPTHHSIEDYSWMRALSGLDIAVPADRAQTRLLLRQLAANPRPTYARIGRVKVPDISTEDGPYDRGTFQVLREGSDVTIIGLGTTASSALIAADSLAAGGVSARVLSAGWLSPLDREAIRDAARQTSAIVTVEEAVTTGGLGAAVAMVVAESPSDRVRVKSLGFDQFAPTGSAEFLLDKFGLNSTGIHDATLEVLNS